MAADDRRTDGAGPGRQRPAHSALGDTPPAAIPYQLSHRPLSRRPAQMDARSLQPSRDRSRRRAVHPASKDQTLRAPHDTRRPPVSWSANHPPALPQSGRPESPRPGPDVLEIGHAIQESTSDAHDLLRSRATEAYAAPHADATAANARASPLATAAAADACSTLAVPKGFRI